ncbi:hypothetical protein AMJ85_01510 [candidate division BRC1 bacterium SM23_51]|nr:MAG: hypothetical protein AMJ85_01510 [candidate division BRC1 bacterium SM23_51]
MGEDQRKADWLQVTEETNALDCLKRVCLFALQAEEDRLAWKWAVIALHSALYSFAICACEGTANLAVVRETKRGRRLIAIENALKLCQDDSYMRKWFGGHAIQLTSEQKQAFRFLKKIRDQFEHYQPMLWAIAYQELPYHAMQILDVIHSLSETRTWCHPPAGFFEEVRSTITKCRTILQESRAHREFNEMMRKQETLNVSDQDLRKRPDSSGPEHGAIGISCEAVFSAPEPHADPLPGNADGKT